MCRYILIALLVVLVALMVVAALVVQQYGWHGFLGLVAVLVMLGYLAKKSAWPVFLYLLTRPLKKMGAALRGARVVVHSITPCDRPSAEDYDPGFDDCGDDDQEAIEDWESDENENEDASDRDEVPTPPLQLDWYQVEFTVIPPDAGSSEGRIVHRRAWCPQMISAVGARPELKRANPFRGWPPPDLFTDFVHNTLPEVWDGTEFTISEAEIFGERRLRMRIGVTRKVQTATLTYAQYTDIGEVRIPRIDVFPEPTS